MKRFVNTFYPFAVIAVLLSVADRYQPDAFDVGEVVGYQVPLGTHIKDAVATLIESMDFTR